jgi:cytochrome b561
MTGRTVKLGLSMLLEAAFLLWVVLSSVVLFLARSAEGKDLLQWTETFVILGATIGILIVLRMLLKSFGASPYSPRLPSVRGEGHKSDTRRGIAQGAGRVDEK